MGSKGCFLFYPEPRGTDVIRHCHVFQIWSLSETIYPLRVNDDRARGYREIKSVIVNNH